MASDLKHKTVEQLHTEIASNQSYSKKLYAKVNGLSQRTEWAKIYLIKRYIINRPALAKFEDYDQGQLSEAILSCQRIITQAQRDTDWERSGAMGQVLIFLGVLHEHKFGFGKPDVFEQGAGI